MIQYALKCDKGHCFDSWFQSASAYDKLAVAGMVSCAVCGSDKVEKAIMTPRVNATRQDMSLKTPLSKEEAALAEMRRKIEDNADYVGTEFADEARAIHNGDVPDRAIYGEARPADAKALIEDGIPVAPLPFMPARKTN